MKRESKKLLLENLKKTPIIEVACSKSNIGRTTFYRWKKESPKFAKQADEALREGNSFITDAAISQLINLIKKGNFQAVMAWLRSYHPDFGNKLEISGELKTVQEKLTEDQQDSLKQALNFAEKMVNKYSEEKHEKEKNRTNSKS